MSPKDEIQNSPYLPIVPCLLIAVCYYKIIFAFKIPLGINIFGLISFFFITINHAKINILNLNAIPAKIRKAQRCLCDQDDWAGRILTYVILQKENDP